MKPKILIYDIETMGLLGWAWEKRETDLWEVIHDAHLLCFSYKWYGQKKTHVVSLTDFKRYSYDKCNDIDVAKALWELQSEADICIAHNGNSFDNKVAMGRYIYHKLGPPAPYQSIDTYRVARSVARFSSNKLDDLLKHLSLGEKLKHSGKDLWLQCHKGDKKAWKQMIAYNKKDTSELEKLYTELLPYIKNHPALNIIADRPNACPKCLGTQIQSRGYGVPTKTGRRRRYACMTCGAWIMGRDFFRAYPKYTN